MQRLFCVLALMALGVFVVAGSGCAARPAGGGGGGGTNTNDNNTNVNDNNVNDNNVNDNNVNDNNVNDNNVNDNNVNDNNVNDNEGPALVKTHIVMDDNLSIMRPKAGDDLIVWGDEQKVYYIIPSETDSDATTATEFPESARFAWTHFAVAGKKVALVTSLGDVRVYDTATGEYRDFPPTQILLQETQLVDDTLPGLTQASGELFATINNTDQVADGNAIKVIDAAGADPDAWEIISFANPIDRIGDPVESWAQVAVDAGTRQVAAVANDDNLYVWDIDNPEADPLFIEMNLGTDLCCVNSQVQMSFEGGLLFYQQDPDDLPLGLGNTLAVLLNVNDATMTVFDNNPTTHNAPMAMAGGSFGYCQWRESLDAQMVASSSFRSAIGRVADAPASTLASQFDTYALRPTIFTFDPISQEECFDDPKLIGYGSSMCITPDGSRWFLAGEGPIDDRLDYLQMSTGGVFTDFADPEQSTMSGSVMATDVSCSSNVVAFRALRSEDDGLGCSSSDEWVVGFILLDRLED